VKLLVEQRILEDMVEDILLEHVFGPTDGQISEADAVSLPGTKDKSLSGRARDMLRRRFGGRGKGLSPMGDAPESKPGFLDKIAQKLGLSRDFEKMLDKIPPNDQERLINAFSAKPPNVNGLKDGSWSPKLGDVYAYKPMSGKSQGYAIVEHIGIGDSKGSRGLKKAGLLLKIRVLSSTPSAGKTFQAQKKSGKFSGTRLNSNRFFFTPEKLGTLLHGKFPDEDTAKAAIMTQVAQNLEEVKRQIVENLMREL